MAPDDKTKRRRDTPTAKLVQVARLYYKDGLPQREIAERIGVSRSMVAQYLIRARDEGLVRIEIAEPNELCVDLADDLRAKTGVPHIEIVEDAGQPALALRDITLRAAEFLDSQLRPNDVLGLAWGRSVMEVVNAFSPQFRRPADVVPLLGERSNLNAYTQLNQLVMQTAARLGGTPHFLLAPMLVGSPRLRDDLLKEVEVNRVIDSWRRLDVACFGVGVVPPTAGMIPYLGEEFIPTLEQAGAVCDICGRYFDRTGEAIPTGLENRMICIDIPELRKARVAIAIAHGAEKGRAVAAALRSGVISALFTDRACAEVVLDEQGQHTNEQERTDG